MIKCSTLLIFCLMAGPVAIAQVKSSYLYNTQMPYGTLDIRTKISSSHYYYLLEGKTFSFRESSPGIRTNKYRDMTSWESSPYIQGNMRVKNGTRDKFVMNYRLLKPNGYQSTYVDGYPLIVIMHGAVERGNCYYTSCYHSNFSYDPNTNSPPAPKTVDHKLLNNDHHLSIGGKQHLDARNLAGTKLPNDPTLASRAFSGFVLMPQMMNIWDSLNVQDVIRMVQLHCKKYKIDQNRIYIHGLSIGGYAVYEAIKRAPWLFTAALPMSAVREAGNIFVHKQESKVAHLPLWIFQGGTDKDPSPTFTEGIISKFKNAGATPRYTKYATLGHNVWNKAYGEPDFFSWMKAKNKANLHPYKGITNIVKSKSQYPKLMLAEGFFAYQWEKNGAIISTAKSNTLTITSPGKYRARFSRISSMPTASQWNRWSDLITITESTSTTTARTDEEAIDPEEIESELSLSVYPNPTTSEQLTILIAHGSGNQTQVDMADAYGRIVFSSVIENDVAQPITVPSDILIPPGLYIVTARDERKKILRKIIIK